MKVLQSTTDTSVEHQLKQYPRPQRVVSTFNIFISGQKTEVVSTRGLKYTYLTVGEVDYYVTGLLETDSRWKVIDKPDS